MFSVYYFSTSGDITYLVCHLISQEDVIEGSYDVLCQRHSFYATTLPSLVTIDTAVVQVFWFQFVT